MNHIETPAEAFPAASAGQTASGQMSGEGVWPLAPPVHPPCTCTHIYGGHDIARNGARTKCLHITGPRGTSCGCKRYEPAVTDGD